MLERWTEWPCAESLAPTERRRDAFSSDQHAHDLFARDASEARVSDDVPVLTDQQELDITALLCRFVDQLTAVFERCETKPAGHRRRDRVGSQLRFSITGSTNLRDPQRHDRDCRSQADQNDQQRRDR